MDAEVRKMIAEAYEQTRKLLLDNKDKLGVVCIRTFLTYIYKVIDFVYNFSYTH